MLPYFAFTRGLVSPASECTFGREPAALHPFRTCLSCSSSQGHGPSWGKPTSDVWINRALALSAVPEIIWKGHLRPEHCTGLPEPVVSLQHISLSLSVCSCFLSLTHASFSRAPCNKHPHGKFHLRVVFPENPTCHKTLLCNKPPCVCMNTPDSFVPSLFSLNVYSLDALHCAKYQDTVRNKTRHDLWSHGA